MRLVRRWFLARDGCGPGAIGHDDGSTETFRRALHGTTLSESNGIARSGDRDRQGRAIGGAAGSLSLLRALWR